MITRSTKLIAMIFVLAVIASGCAPFNVQANQNTPTAASVPTDLPTPTLAPTELPAQPSPIVQPTSIPLLHPTPTIDYPVPDGVNPSIITLDNNNQLITLHPGENFLLKLGEIYQWDIKLDDQNVISRVPNIAVIRGAQGIYLAHKAGNATLSATGDPLCRQTKPACGIPSILFTLHIEVMP